jgi:hypothetical protein
MFSIKLLYILVAFPIFLIGNATFIGCKKMEEKSKIVQSDFPFIIDSKTPSRIISLKIDKKLIADSSKINLKLSEIELSEPPDGSYEVSLGDSEKDLAFVEVLDLYTIQANKNATIYISIENIISSKKIKDNIILQLAFKGNRLANNLISKKAGYLKIGQLKIVASN